MENNKKLIKIVLGCLCLMGGIMYWLMSSSAVPPDKTTTAPPEVAPRAVQNANLTETKNGKTSWELQVNTLTYDVKKEGATMEGIQGKFYAEDGTIMTVTADTGTVNMQTKNVVLTKNPKGITSDNGTLTADKVTWLNDKRQVLAEGNVHITKDDTVATSQKATMDVAINKAKLEKDAKVTKGVKR